MPLHWASRDAAIRQLDPDPDEIRQVARGRATFGIGDGPEGAAGPSELVLARQGVPYRIRVRGDAPLRLLASPAPNEDEPDGMIELEPSEAGQR